MLICHIHFSNFPFHTTPIPYEITKNLKDQGVNSHVIALAMNSEDKIEEDIDGVHVTRVPIYKSQRNIFTLERFSQITNSILLKEKFDLIHVYAFRGSSYLRLRNPGSNKKWLFHIITGNVFGGTKSTISNLMTRFDSKLFGSIIVNTRNVGEWVLGSRSFNEIPPGVDTNRFIPGINQKFRDNLGFKSTDVVAVYSGSLSPLRKLDVLLHGFAFAVQKCNRLKLVVIGPGDKELILRISRNLNISDKVLILGHIPYKCVQDYISIADIGLAYVPITPEYNPQPALKTLELLSSGKPVIATETKGNAYFVKDGVNGILIKDNPEAIARSLLLVIEDHQLRRKISNAARSSVIKYDWGGIVRNQLIPLYCQLVDN